VLVGKVFYMRVILAGLFVFVGLLLAVGFVSSVLPKNFPPAITGIALAAFMLILAIAAFFLFNRRGADLSGYKSAHEQILELEQQGLLIKADYKAHRAFGVEEFEDEGSHYFIELEDGGVLYLNGQYLDDYEPIGSERPRAFPCTEFTLLRHKDEGWVIDIQCRGFVLEPEFVAPSFLQSDFKVGFLVPENGEMVHNHSYDQIKNEVLHLLK
jgi:hypothetical protein